VLLPVVAGLQPGKRRLVGAIGAVALQEWAAAAWPGWDYSSGEEDGGAANRRWLSDVDSHGGGATRTINRRGSSAGVGDRLLQARPAAGAVRPSAAELCAAVEQLLRLAGAAPALYQLGDSTPAATLHHYFCMLHLEMVFVTQAGSTGELVGALTKAALTKPPPVDARPGARALCCIAVHARWTRLSVRRDWLPVGLAVTVSANGWQDVVGAP
jgi:hypothetical protein